MTCFEPKINPTKLLEDHFSNLTFDDLSSFKDELLHKGQCVRKVMYVRYNKQNVQLTLKYKVTNNSPVMKLLIFQN